MTTAAAPAKATAKSRAGNADYLEQAADERDQHEGGAQVVADEDQAKATARSARGTARRCRDPVERGRAACGEDQSAPDEDEASLASSEGWIVNRPGR